MTWQQKIVWWLIICTNVFLIAMILTGCKEQNSVGNWYYYEQWDTERKADL